MGGISGLFKSIKKKITLKGVVHAVEVIPGVGNVVKVAEDVFSAAKNAATNAAQNTAAAASSSSAAAAAGSASGAAAGASTADLAKNPLVWVGVGLAALFLLRRR